MKIKEIYEESIKEGFVWLTLLIEFLVFEKEVISFEDDRDALDLYLKDNNQYRMNKLLHEYRRELKQYEGRISV